MGEDLKIVPPPETTDEYKWLAQANIRLLLNEMNNLGIQKEDIVSLIFNEQYILVYRKKVVK